MAIRAWEMSGNLAFAFVHPLWDGFGLQGMPLAIRAAGESFNT